MSYLWIIIAGVSWGLIGIFTKAVTALGFTEMEMLFVKGVVSTVFLAVLLLIKDRQSFQLKRKTDLFYFVGTGILSFTFFSWCYMKAINLTSVGVAAVLLYTAPTIVMLLSIVLFKEKNIGFGDDILWMWNGNGNFRRWICPNAGGILIWDGICHWICVI